MRAARFLAGSLGLLIAVSSNQSRADVLDTKATSSVISVKRFADCEGYPRQFQGKTIGPIPSVRGTAYLLTGSKGTTSESAVAFLISEDSSDAKSCKVFPLKKPRAVEKGVWQAGMPQAQIQAVASAERCETEFCSLALMVMQAEPTENLKRPSFALATKESCSEGVILRKVQLFADRDALEVTCRESAGAGYHEHRWLVAIDDGALRVLYEMNAGSAEFLSDEEKRAGDCPIKPAGWIRVVKSGPEPVIRVLIPESEDMQDSRGTTRVYDWHYEPKTHRFVRAEKGVRTPFDARAGCRHKQL
jgi:hypothetical protein